MGVRAARSQRRLIREAVAGLYHFSSSRGDQGLTVAQVVGQTGRVSDPGPMLLIEPHPVNGEALRNDLVAVHDEQAPTMMCVVVAAALARPPPKGRCARAEPTSTAVGRAAGRDRPSS
jgi:hypothetical protein